MTEDEIYEAVGRVADDLDSLLYALDLKISDKLKIDGFAAGMRRARDTLAKIVIKASGENPWQDNPLEG